MPWRSWSGSWAARARRWRRAGQRPARARVEGGVKVFELTIEEMEHRIDAKKDPVEGPRLQRHLAGPAADRDRGRPRPRHVHEQHARDDRHPFPWPAAAERRWTASRMSPRTRSSPASHSPTSSSPGHPDRTCTTRHHNATDQVGRGLLGAFIVEPKDPADRYDGLYGVTQDIIWISNDSLGGFTINGRGFPATSPIVARSATRSSSGS